MKKGITFSDRESALEFARQFRNAEVKAMGLLFRKWRVFVDEGEFNAENYRRRLRGLPSLEGEIKEGEK